MKRIAFHNLGCKVNTYELDAIIGEFKSHGYEIVSFDSKADIYVINTCSVTNIADRKSRQILHRARKLNPESLIVATGCYVQTRDIDSLKKEGINLMVGNNLKGRLYEYVQDYLLGGGNDSKIIVSNLAEDRSYDDMHVDNSEEHTRVFIKIQDGCNQFCTYCIIPFARGRVRSRKPEDIIDEIKTLTEKGYRELVITGIHISSYGTDFIYDDVKADRFRPEYLLELIKRIAELKGVDRIRLGSLEPRIATREFIGGLSRIKKVCPHFHLSLQSGSDSVLKRMNRHYTAAEYRECVEIIRDCYEHPAITTDVIVGFPGETEEEFRECAEYAKLIDFYEMHIFKYSRRAGTIADKMKGQHTEATKHERSCVLEEIDRRGREAFVRYYVGREVQVLFEEKKLIDGVEYWTGHTPEYVKVLYESKENLENSLVVVRGMDVKEDYLVAGR